MPATFGVLGGAIAARLAAWPRKIKLLRGTRLRPFTGARGGRLWALLTGGVPLAGVPLILQDETIPFPAFVPTVSGQSSALRALMAYSFLLSSRHLFRMFTRLIFIPFFSF